MNMYINHMCTYTYERIAMRPFRQNRYAQDSKPRGCPMTWLPWPTKPVWTHWQTGKEKTLADIKYNYCILGQPCVNALLKHFCLFEPVWAKRFSMLNFIDTIYIYWMQTWLIGGYARDVRVYARGKKNTYNVRVCARYTSGWYVRNYGKIICQGGDHSKQSILCLVFDVIVAAVTSHWFSESLNCPKLGF